jgi:hypothetical protein
MTKQSHPELDGQKPETLYRFELKRPGQTLRERLLWTALGLSVGAGLALGYGALGPAGDGLFGRSWFWSSRQSSATAAEDPFRQGAERAMAAAELTQTAEFSEEWATVVMGWQRAIAYMKAVPKTSANSDLAQAKVLEYERNMQYAQSNVNTRASRTPDNKTYWTLGSDRDLVIAIQGPPAQTMQYQSACQQTLRYDNSIVELNNGYVKQYNNPDGTLSVLAEGATVMSASATPGTWTLGSTEAEILQLQGTPTRQEQYTSNRFTTLYYGKSSILFENGQAIGYLNTDKNLKVSINLPDLPAGQVLPQTWSLGSSRSEVLRVEGQPPLAISRNDTNCEEVFNFEAGEVTFHQGLVTGYNDHGSALRVR